MRCRGNPTRYVHQRAIVLNQQLLEADVDMLAAASILIDLRLEAVSRGVVTGGPPRRQSEVKHSITYKYRTRLGRTFLYTFVVALLFAFAALCGSGLLLGHRVLGGAVGLVVYLY